MLGTPAIVLGGPHLASHKPVAKAIMLTSWQHHMGSRRFRKGVGWMESGGNTNHYTTADLQRQLVEYLEALT